MPLTQEFTTGTPLTQEFRNGMPLTQEFRVGCVQHQEGLDREVAVSFDCSPCRAAPGLVASGPWKETKTLTGS